MPPARRPPSSTFHQATRQQLDELDALIQRMLALPVNAPEDLPGVPTPPDQGVTDSESPAASPVLPSTGPSEPEGPLQAENQKTGGAAATTDLSEAAPVPEAPALPFLDPAGLPAAEETTKPFPDASSLAEASAMPGTEEGRRQELLPSQYSVLRSPPPPVTPSPRPLTTPSQAWPADRAEEKAAPLRLAWPLRPLLWVNQAFDHATVCLGPIGRGLRGPGGRALLGWTGLLLLLAALAWLVLDGMGWTW